MRYYVFGKSWSSFVLDYYTYFRPCIQHTSKQAPRAQKQSSRTTHFPLCLLGRNSAYNVTDWGTAPILKPTMNLNKIVFMNNLIYHFLKKTFLLFRMIFNTTVRSSMNKCKFFTWNYRKYFIFQMFIYISIREVCY